MYTRTIAVVYQVYTGSHDITPGVRFISQNTRMTKFKQHIYAPDISRKTCTVHYIFVVQVSVP